jgi:reductive dehalogenase
MLTSISTIIAGVVFLTMVYSTITSIKEKEKRAAIIFFSLGIILPIIFLLPNLCLYPLNEILGGVFALLFFLVILISFFPFHQKLRTEGIVPREKIDERDTMFSRNILEPGSENYQAYYTSHPEKQPLDDAFRKNPGLLEKGTAFYDKNIFSAATANFDIIEANRAFVTGNTEETKEQQEARETTEFIQNLTEKMGAHSVGITELKDYHLYSHRGREYNYGEKVKNSHKYAIAFTVEMNHDFIRNAPYALSILESSRQYVRSGIIAIRIAQYIRRMGYDARAHIDGEYEVVCPLVARDANLGEIGRMGLLMTPDLGPRVRIAAVTTSIPLIPDKRKENSSMIDFCKTCKKCADICPSNAIPFDDRKEINGVLRWQINQEACFTYWTKAGTDCGRCISVCPYSHPDNNLHKVVRYGIKNSPLFRYFAVKMDDIFYGRKPKPLKLPDWFSSK